MASTNKTPHLGLCQWAATDPFLREDMNGDFAKIDEAIGGMSRVKLFDITVTETVSLVQLDFSELDMEQFAELQLFFNLAKSSGKFMRINGYSDNNYTTSTPLAGGSAVNKLSICNGSTSIFITGTHFFHRLNCGFRMESVDRRYIPDLSTLELYASSSEDRFIADDRITVWGVRR